jgi:hypothetical protein
VGILYRRYQPHWHADDREIFLTWRLRASLPRRLTEAAMGLRYRVALN